jgi:hypothetical protein
MYLQLSSAKQERKEDGDAWVRVTYQNLNKSK